jgi:serine/threonine protein kinase
MSLGMLGKYERLDILGHGASGIVYLAQDTFLKRRVAIKEINAHGEEKQRVLDEARVLDRLRHPNIVAVNSVDTINGKVVIDMEYIPGSNLLEILRVHDGPLPLPDCINITAQICDGLAYAHSQRTVHRDIKPANILVSNQQEVKLVDFGLAQVLGTNSYAGGAGTFAYMAPEDFEEGDKSDRQSDIWAVGVILYEMLTGRRPFTVANARDPFAWSRAIAKDDVQPPSFYQVGIPPEIDRICLKALAREKHDRYDDAREMASDLRSVEGEADAPISETLRSLTSSQSRPVMPGKSINPILEGWVDVDGFLVNAPSNWETARTVLADGSLQYWLSDINEPLLARVAAELEEGPDDTLDSRLRDFLYRTGLELEPAAKEDARKGAALIRTRNYGDAVQLLERAIRLDPGHPSYHRLLGQAARGAGNVDLARDVLQRGLSRHPGDRHLRQDLADIGGAAPELSVDSVDFGAVHHGEGRSSQVVLRAIGKSPVKGRVASAPVWLTVAPMTFSNKSRQLLKLEADSTVLPEDGREYVEDLILETTGGTIEMPISLTVLPLRPSFNSIFRWYTTVFLFSMLPAIVGLFMTLTSRQNGHEFLLLPAGLIESGLLFVSFFIININADIIYMERIVAAVGIAFLPLGAYQFGVHMSNPTIIFQRAVPISILTIIISLAVPLAQAAAFAKFREVYYKQSLWCTTIAASSALTTIILWLSAH